jgi:hypothetical protein
MEDIFLLTLGVLGVAISIVVKLIFAAMDADR